MSKPGLFLWKKALKHSKKYFVSGCLKQDRVPGNGVFHTLDLEKAFSFRGLHPHRGVALGLMIETTEFYILVPVWMILTFIQGHRNQNYCANFLEKKLYGLLKLMLTLFCTNNIQER